MADNECIPASLRIGATPAPRPEVPFDVLLRGITSNYAEWITNSPHWDRNDTRNLIITMKVALERLQQERDEARREVMSWISDQACRSEDIDREYAERGWEYLKEQP